MKGSDNQETNKNCVVSMFSIETRKKNKKEEEANNIVLNRYYVFSIIRIISARVRVLSIPVSAIVRQHFYFVDQIERSWSRPQS